MENWKEIPGWEGFYKVSDLGRVASIDRMVPVKGGSRKSRGRVLKTKVTRDGYEGISLSRNQKRTCYTIHILVMLAFVGPRPNGMQTCHADGNRRNNRLSNLRYDTPKSNHADKDIHGTKARGSKINTSKLTEQDVVSIREKRAAGAKVTDLAEIFGISSTAVSKICVGDNWSHVGGPLVARNTIHSELRN